MLSSEAEAMLDLLPPPLQQKALSFVKDSDRRAYLAGCILLSAYIPDWQRIEVNVWGKPFLPNSSWHFNLSHSGDWVVLALSNQGIIGVDVETVRPLLYDNFKHCFSSNEWQNITQASQPLLHFYKAWTQKESIVKADGRGLSIELQDVVIDEQGGYIRDTYPLRYTSDFINIDKSCMVCVSYPL